jgi:Spy/CpxP family protein refolding chaperone
MDKSSKNRWQVRGAALLIFLLGAAAGALGLNVYHAWSHSRAAQGGDRFEQMAKRLQLSAEQQTQVKQIFDDTRTQLQAVRRESEPRVAEIRQRADERLRQTLTPEQWQRFQQLREEMRGHERHGRAGDGAPSGGDR